MVRAHLNKIIFQFFFIQNLILVKEHGFTIHSSEVSSFDAQKYPLNDFDSILNTFL